MSFYRISVCPLGKSVFSAFALVIALYSTLCAGQEGDAPFEIDGRIATVSAIPDPKLADYADCLTVMKCQIESVLYGEYEPEEILIVTWAFRERKLSESGKLGVDDRIQFTARPFSELPEALHTVMMVDDSEEYALDLYWVEEWDLVSKARQRPAWAETAAAEPEAGGGVPGEVERMLLVLEAHGGETIGNAQTPMLFSEYEYLYGKDFWELAAARRTEKVIGPLDAILEFRDFLASRGIELLLTFPPAKAALYPEYATNIPYDPARDGRIDFEFQRFLGLLDEAKVAYVDLVPTFLENRWVEEADGKSYPLYFESDIHWAPVGAHLAGKEIARVLKASDRYEALRAAVAFSPIPYEFEHTVLYKENGSNTRGNPEWGYPAPAYYGYEIGAWGPRAFMRERNHPDAAVWLLGDSFAQRFLFRTLMAELGVPIHVVSTGDGSPTIARRTFARTRDKSHVKLVIWEIQTHLLSMASKWESVKVYPEGGTGIR